MNQIKKTSLFLFIIVVCLCFTACSGAYVPYDYDLGEYVTLGEYKGIKCEALNIGVDDADMQQAIWSDMREHGYGEKNELTSGTVILGDTVKVDITGMIDGQVDAGLGAIGLELEVGSDTFLDDFENGLIGRTIGQNCTVEVHFPVDYLKPVYADKVAIYDVKIHSVMRMTYPELDNEIVSDISECKTVEEYRKQTREELERLSLEQSDLEREEDVWSKVVSAATILKFPQDALDFLIKDGREQFEKTAEEEGKTLNEYLADNNLTTEEFEQYLNARAHRLCKEELVMHAIARQEALEVAKEETDKLAQTYADTYGYKSVDELYEHYSKELVEQTLLYQKVKDFVVANASEIG